MTIARETFPGGWHAILFKEARFAFGPDFIRIQSLRSPKG